jgi:biopolymer transport protein ExbD
MAFEVGGSKSKVRPSMNVTPLVDVVLVLLIIFMVVTPMLTKQFWMNVPKKDEKEQQEPPPDSPPPVVIGVKNNGEILINKDPVADAELQNKLRRIFAARQDHTMFFHAEADVPFGRAMEVLDLARGGGASTIAVVTEPFTL